MFFIIPNRRESFTFSLIPLCTLVLFSVSLHAQTTKTFITTGNWSVPANWSPSGVPAANDIIVISAGIDLTVDDNVTCDSIYFDAGSTSSSISINSGKTLTVTHNIHFTNPTANNVTQSIAVGDGTLICDSIWFENTSNSTRINSVTIGLGTVSLNRIYMRANSATENQMVFTSSGLLQVGKSWTPGTSTFTPSTGTVEYNGNSAQSIRAGTFNKLKISGSGTTTLGGSTIVNDSLIIESGATLDNSANISLTTNGVLEIRGTYQESNTQGSVTLNGLIHIASSGTFQSTVNEAFTIRNGIINEGTFTSGNGRYTFNTNNQTLSGTNEMIFTGPVTITGVTLTNELASLKINGSVAGTGTLINTAGNTINLASNSFTIASLDATAANNTIIYSRSGSQSIINTSYQNLTLSGSGTKTATGNLLINDNLTIDNGVTLSLSTYTLSVGLGFTSSGTSSSTLTTYNTSANPIPNDQTWNFTVRYASTSSQTVVRGTYISLNISSGNRVLDNGGTITITNTYTPGSGTFTVTGNTIEFAGSGSQTIPAARYNNIVSTNTGSRTLASSGTIYILGAFTPGTNSYTVTNSTINFNSSGAQNIPEFGYYNVSITDAATKTITGDVTINGNLTITNGKLAIGSNTLTISRTLTSSSVNCFIANGNSNLIINGSVALGSNLYFDQSNIGTSNRLNNLTINRTGRTITIGNALQIKGSLNPTAGTLATANNLTLISNASNTASITEGTGNYITGNVTIQRYIPAVARRWRFMSSPVNGSNLLDWRGETFITGPGTGNVVGTLNSNGFDATATNSPSVYWYDESVITGDFNSGWTNPSTINNTLSTGVGYRVFLRGDRSDLGRLNNTNNTQNEITLNLTQAVNKGDISMPVTYTSSGIPDNDGWNLVGNPYPCAFDWNAFHDAGRSGNSGTNYANISPTIWVLDPQDNSYKYYNALTNAGNITDGIIAQGQAFWIKAVTSSPSMTFKESFKTTATPDNLFKVSPNSAFTIRVSKDSLNADELIVKYIQGAVNTKDDYDVIKLSSPIIIGAWGSDSVILALSARNIPTTNDTIKLYIGTSSSGSFTFNFKNTHLIDLLDHVFLVDNYTNSIINLKQNPTYIFNISTSNNLTFGYNRFYIVVASNSALPVGLIAFSGSKTQTNTSLLNWSTANELNCSHFEVEYSSDNLEFTSIATIPAKGTSNTLNVYQYIHSNPLTYNYYRIKIADKDGSYNYSNTIAIDYSQTNVNNNSSLSIFPNPTTKYVIIQLNENTEIKEIEFYNESGKLIMQKTCNGNRQNIDVSTLETGVYFIRVIDNNETIFQDKIFKK